MRTYNFIIWDSFGESQFIEINAKSEDEALIKLSKLPVGITYFSLLS